MVVERERLRKRGRLPAIYTVSLPSAPVVRAVPTFLRHDGDGEWLWGGTTNGSSREQADARSFSRGVAAFAAFGAGEGRRRRRRRQRMRAAAAAAPAVVGSDGEARRAETLSSYRRPRGVVDD